MTVRLDALAIVADPREFDRRSGNWLERTVFNHRLLLVTLCALLTVFFAYQASKLTINASYEGMMPTGHPYVQNYLSNKESLLGLGNTIRVVVENRDGDIYDPGYLDALARINDALYLTPGVDRAWMKSLWTPLIRWTEVTEEGFNGGPVMPARYDGSDGSIDELRINIQRAGLIGSLVSNDLRSSMIVVPILDEYADTKQPLDYQSLSHLLERNARDVENDGKVRVYIVGFAKLVGDLINGLVRVMWFFVAAAGTAAIVIYLYTRCLRSTTLVILCSLIAVVWQVGIMVLLGRSLNPFTILVPFLVFAIGVSHGAQKMNGIMQDIGRGNHKWVAARYTFRRLIVAGLTALLADAVGFGVLMLIDIPVIRELALFASVGVAILIFTNLFLLPVLLSYTGVAPTAAAYALREESGVNSGRGLGRFWDSLSRFTQPKWAIGALVPAVILTAACFHISLQLKIGDLDAGAPELRPESRYNRDNAFVNRNFGLSSDVFAVMVQTGKGGCSDFRTLVEADRLGERLREVPGVQTTTSFVDTVKSYTMGNYEGNPKWWTVSRDPTVLGSAANIAFNWGTDQVDADCSLLPVNAFLVDHKADTLSRVVEAASAFSAEHTTSERHFLLAAGSAGIEAATNEVVRELNLKMLLYVYAAVIVLCFIAFRSWRAVVVAVVPLIVTSIFAEALMVMMGIGVKVATLPVIALGVGIGVDYALYLLSVQLAQQRAGVPLEEAFRRAVSFTGKVVALIGITLAAGVITWIWSPIKFQADMGILLAFMFLWNMIGALVLVPALSCFLLRDFGRPDPASTTPKSVLEGRCCDEVTGMPAMAEEVR